MSLLLDIDRAGSIFALLFLFVKEELDPEFSERQFRQALLEITLGAKIPDPSISKLRTVFQNVIESEASLRDFALQVRQDLVNEREMLVLVVSVLLRLCSEDGMFGRYDKIRLKQVLDIFCLSALEFETLSQQDQAILAECFRTMPQQELISVELREHYHTLGCAPDASDIEVRRRYRRLAMQLHPDRVAARGDTSDPRADFERVHRAYEAIRESRS